MNMRSFFSFCVLLLSGSIVAQPYAASNFTLQGQLDPEVNSIGGGVKYSGCWGWYQSANNREYAIAGSVNGTYWVDITIPASPTVSCFRSGKQGCTWREIKSFQNYCYVISDDPGANSFQIFDMQYLPDSVHKVYDSQALFERGHTLWIDGNKLYVAGVSKGSTYFSTMNVYSLANPASPTLIRQLDQDFPVISYVHDMYVRNDTVYASCAYQGLYVFKFQSNNTFAFLGSLASYPFAGYNHSSALTPDGQTLVFTDEVPSGLPIKVANVSNLSNIQIMSTTNQFAQTTPHNPFMINNQYCMVSSYQDGLQLYDISTPGTPFLAGYFDTHPQGGGNNNIWLAGASYNGQWGAYPYYPSKNILALDRQNGIFILRTHLIPSPPPQAVTAGFTASSLKACVGSTLNFVNTSVAATNYTWSYTGGSTSSASSKDLSLFFAIPGTYAVTLLASNATSSASTTQTVSIVNNNLSGVVSLTYASCSTCSTAAAAVNMSGGSAPFSYTWQPSGGNAALASSLTQGCYTVLVTDANNCSYSAPACIEQLTGLGIISVARGPRIYPNPAQGQLNIEDPGTVFDYRIYNKLGQLISSGKNNHQKAIISLTDFPKGIYFVETESGNSKTRQKIIIE